MIYIIIESTDDNLPSITVYTVRKEYEHHLNVCKELYSVLCGGGYRYHGYKVPAEYQQGKKAISRAITKACHGGIKQTELRLRAYRIVEAQDDENPINLS